LSDNNQSIISKLSQISRYLDSSLKDGNIITDETYLTLFNEIEVLDPGFEVAMELAVRDQIIRIILIKGGTRLLPVLENYLDKLTSKYNPYQYQEQQNKLESAIVILGEIGSSSVPLLIKLLTKPQKYEIVRALAAQKIARINDGMKVLKELLREGDTDEGLRYAILEAFSKIAILRNIEKEIEREELPADMQSKEIIQILISHSNDTSPIIRRLILSTLIETNTISIDQINKGVDDLDIEVRKLALDGLSRMNINLSNAATYVKFLEDTNGKICEDAINSLSPNNFRSEIDYEALANLIMELLIIRKTDRPATSFSPDICSKALKKIFVLAPHLYIPSLSQLCDLAYQNDNEIKKRSILVAIRINEREFVALVNEKSKNNKIAAREIYKLMGYTEIPLFIGEPKSEFEIMKRYLKLLFKEWYLLIIAFGELTEIIFNKQLNIILPNWVNYPILCIAFLFANYRIYRSIYLN
jgi:hypothetical protein